MPRDYYDNSEIDRRSFVKASLLPAVLPIASALANASAQAAEQMTDPAVRGPEIIDCNVHLFDWPFRKLKYAKTDALVAKLRKHRIHVYVLNGLPCAAL